MTRAISNAVIKSADIDIERVLTYWVFVEYGSTSAQGFGGFMLGGDFGCWAIDRLLRVVGVERWSELAGRPVRIDGDSCRIYRLGNFLRDEWLDLEALAAECRGGAR